MLRLHRHNKNQSKSGEKLDFKFSSFKALQVPKGWDKLVVSFVSAETGKTASKTSRALVRNGNCQWADIVSESIRVSEETESCLFKLVVSNGSIRSSILGEATINATDYSSASDGVPVSLALKKCTNGTTLQVKVQCLTPRAKSRDEESKHKSSDSEKQNENNQDIDVKSDGSSSTKDFRLISNPGELGSRETSFSLSESHQSYGSAEGSIGGEDSDAQSLVRRADSIGSDDSISPGNHTSSEVYRPKNASENQSKSFREASEGTVEELRAEAKMWEMNARKLMLDLDVLKGEFSDLSRVRENLSSELSEVRDVLKREVERSRSSSSEDLNADVALQLKRSQESNIELVSILRELEETVERQKIEIEDLVASNGKVKLLEQALEEKNQQIEKGKILNSQAFLDVENEYKTRLLEKEEEIVDLEAKLSETLNSTDLNAMIEIEELKVKVHELEKDCTELTDENLDLLLKLKEAKNESAMMVTSVEFPNRTSFEFQLSEQQSPTDSAERAQELQGSIVNTLEAKLGETESELAEKKREMEKLRDNLRSKEEEILVLRQFRIEQEGKISDLRKEKVKIQEHMDIVLQENAIASKCLDDLQNDVAVLASSVDSHSSPRESSDLKTKNIELEIHATGLERENGQLSILVAGLEAQLKGSASRLESAQSELESSRSRSTSLEDEVKRLRTETQSTFESFILECDFLRKSNGELKNENLGLRDSCSTFEAKLEKVTTEFASKEKNLTSKIDALVEENSGHKEKVDREMSSLNQKYIEKVAEAEKLEQEIEHLIRKLTKTHEENERVASDAIEEMAKLQADNGKGTQSIAKAEKQKLEAIVRAVSEERDDLKIEKNELIEKVSSLTTKLMKIDDDLAEIDALRDRDDELERELEEVRNENRQYRLKIEQLEETKLAKEEKQNPKKGSNFSKTNLKVNPVQETAKIAKHRGNHRRSQSQRENGSESPEETSPRDNKAELGSKIQLLEDQLAKALEENSKYKTQLNKFVTENRKVHSDVLKRSSTSEGELVSKSKFERTKSMLEAELREIRERYSSMSLKYAEVECEREELVMKLKSSSMPRTFSKKWFS